MKRWYVLQIYAGYEDQVKTDLERRIQDEGLQEKLGKVLVPSAKMKQMFGALDEGDQQLFPGYVLIEMEEEIEPSMIRFVVAHPRVLRFLGGNAPIPLSQKEVNKIFQKMEGGVVLAVDKNDFAVDSEVTIAEGPFSGFVGVIDKVDVGSERLTVMVSIFGRMTPVELRFDQVKK
jgi:transcriptional antiterminator NusG